LEDRCKSSCAFGGAATAEDPLGSPRHVRQRRDGVGHRREPSELELLTNTESQAWAGWVAKHWQAPRSGMDGLVSPPRLFAHRGGPNILGTEPGQGPPKEIATTRERRAPRAASDSWLRRRSARLTRRQFDELVLERRERLQRGDDAVAEGEMAVEEVPPADTERGAEEPVPVGRLVMDRLTSREDRVLPAAGRGPGRGWPERRHVYEV